VTGSFDPEEGARISAALVKAIVEAKLLADAGNVGPETRELVQHARELYYLLLEQLGAAGPYATEEVRGMASAMGNKLDELEALVTIEVDRQPLH